MDIVNWLKIIIIHHVPKTVTFSKDYYKINDVDISENICFKKFKSINMEYLKAIIVPIYDKR